MKKIEDILSSMADLPSFYGVSNIGVNTVGNFGDKPLHVAVVQNDLEAISLIALNGGDIDAKGEHGYTPLHEAVEQGLLEAIQSLLELGADKEIKNDSGQTPYELAKILYRDEGLMDSISGIFESV